MALVVTAFGLESQATTMSDGIALSVEELVEYCRTQAGLLSGRIETIGAEVDELLDDIDEDIAEIRTGLAEQANGPEGPAVSPPTAGLNEWEDEVSELEEKRTVAEAKRARMAAFEDLVAAYLELAGELQSTVDDGREALDRVVEFERDHDAPAYFDDRQTVLEAVATGPDGPSTD